MNVLLYIYVHNIKKDIKKTLRKTTKSSFVVNVSGWESDSGKDAELKVLSAMLCDVTSVGIWSEIYIYI